MILQSITESWQMNLSDYISRNYNELRRYAGAFTRDPNDLIHHTFIKMHDAGFIYINDQMTDYYFKRSMKNNATRGDFKKQYKIDHEEVENIPEDTTLIDELPLRRLMLYSDILTILTERYLNCIFVVKT